MAGRVWESVATRRGPMVARDYYGVETALGRRFWLFRRLDDGR